MSGRPHVVTHALVSADGRLEGFTADIGRYYELAARLPHDAILAGSGTMVAAAQAEGVDLAGDDEPSGGPADAALPLLVVVDSRGRLTRFDWLRAAGLWRDVMVVGSRRTPAPHCRRLAAAGVELMVHGDDRVDLRAALHALAGDHGVRAVRVDAGPGLNSALLAAGLVDEVSLLVAPYLVGHGRSLVDRPDGAQRLTLTAAQPQADGYVWLRYTVAAG